MICELCHTEATKEKKYCKCYNLVYLYTDERGKDWFFNSDKGPKMYYSATYEEDYDYAI